MDTKTAWDREVALGYDGLDREHGLQLQLLDRLDRLDHATAQGADRAAASEIVQRLLDYSDVHFGSEELLMRLHSYPLYGAHVEEHRRLVAELEEVRVRYLQGAPVTELVRELKGWLRGHIQGMDREFAEHVTGGFRAL